MIAPSDTIIVNKWDVRFPTEKDFNKSVKDALGKKRLICIESYHELEHETESERIIYDCDNEEKSEQSEHNKICIVIRKRKKTSEHLHYSLNDIRIDQDVSAIESKKISERIKELSTVRYTLDLFDLEIDEERNQMHESIMSNFKSIVYKHCIVPVIMYHEGVKQKRQIIFNNKTERDDFYKLISKYKEETLKSQRKRFMELAQTESFRKTAPQLGLTDDYDSFSKVKSAFLIEIVGAEDLPLNCNPFVEVRMLDRVVHRTKVIPNEDNPIWTLRTDSYFILPINAEELLRCNDGIHFIVYDQRRRPLSDKILGAICLPIYSLYTKPESREEYNLQPYVMGNTPGGCNGGSIAIRCRPASDDDNQFMKTYRTLKSKAGTDHCPKINYNTKTRSNRTKMRNLWKSQTRSTVVDGIQVKMRRSLPYQDPDRPLTKWMTENEIESEVIKPSLEWIDTGSGELARIYFEVLQCEDLPNVDVGRGIEHNKSDPFVQLVYEDCTRRTDVIDDCLSPIWLPWTQRAFIFHTVHPSSQIFLGVFDYDNIGTHELLGRCVIDVTHLRPQTEYVLDYKLVDTHTQTDQKSMPRIKIRIRIEVDDQQALALASLSPPPTLYINSFEKKGFRVISDAVIGTDDLKEFSLEHIVALYEEIMSYCDYKQYIVVATLDLIMWRCTYHFEMPVSNLNYVPSFLMKCAVAISPEKICAVRQLSKMTISLPLDSIVVFICGVTLVENISLLPTYIFFLCGWTLIAVLNWRQNHPDPWYRSIGLIEGLSCLVAGTELVPIHNITPDTKIKESIDKFNEVWAERFKLAHERKAKLANIAQKQYDEIADEMDEFGVNNDLSSRIEKRSLRLNPKYQVVQLLKPLLYPYQQQLLTICESLRFSRNVITWQEYYFSLYTSAACFTIAAISYQIPWAFIFKWVARIAVWSLFGPWIKLACIYYGTDISRIFESRMLEVHEWEKNSNILVKNARKTHEEALKKRSFKQYLFGAYMVNVPLIKRDKVIQRPLLSSTATAIDRESSATLKVRHLT